MKIPLSWLKNHLDTQATVNQIAERLTALGLEVESIEDLSQTLAPFTVGYIIKTERHPNADKLQVCTVETKEGVLQIVCGAPNARQGLKVVFAPVGSVIPATGMELKKSTIRGVESQGMLCAARELGLPDDNDKGIMELPTSAPVGVPFAPLLGLADPVIEVALTANRVDCAGIRGIARDLAASGLGTLKPIHTESVRGTFKNPISIQLDFPPEAAKACPQFAGRLIKGVRNGPSPSWLQDKLKAIGLRPISALVDITNYFCFDQARPLHVFDADKLKGHLKIRLSRSGETLSALNGKTYTLDEGMTVVTDDTGVLGLGGIIGGESTGCTEATTNVFLECALFDPVRTAMTGRKLELITDARYRFERGVDPASVIPGLEAATRMILELCGGEASTVTNAGHEPEWRRSYTLRPNRCETLGGVPLPAVQQGEILTALGCTVIDEAGGLIRVTPPSWRGDILGEADLVEEILRVLGLDKIPAVPLEKPTPLTQPALTLTQKRPLQVRRALAARGFEEAVTWSFMSQELASLFGKIDSSMQLVNPISVELDTLRPSILPNLLAAAGRNAARGLTDVMLYEIGPIFRSGTPGDQVLTAAGIRVGQSGPRHWAEKPRPVDTFDAKADALIALETAGISLSSLQVSAEGPDYYHPGRKGTLRLGPVALGYFGEIHPAILQTLKVDGPAVAFEVFLDPIPQPKKKASPAKSLVELSPFQPVSRDFAFILDQKVEAEQVLRAAKGVDKSLIREAQIFDIYVGPGVPEGKKSLALTVTLQPTERTLTEAEIDSLGQKLVAAVTKATGATLRG